MIIKSYLPNTSALPDLHDTDSHQPSCRQYKAISISFHILKSLPWKCRFRAKKEASSTRRVDILVPRCRQHAIEEMRRLWSLHSRRILISMHEGDAMAAHCKRHAFGAMSNVLTCYSRKVLSFIRRLGTMLMPFKQHAIMVMARLSRCCLPRR